jgi:hypothetical protein
MHHGWTFKKMNPMALASMTHKNHLHYTSFTFGKGLLNFEIVKHVVWILNFSNITFLKLWMFLRCG